MYHKEVISAPPLKTVFFKPWWIADKKSIFVQAKSQDLRANAVLSLDLSTHTVFS